jgi:hypothetical protein
MAAFSAGASGAGARRGPHRDDGGRRHEEIYIVLEGRAGFMLHGEELDAPAGTFVRVDVAVRRRAWPSSRERACWRWAAHRPSSRRHRSGSSAPARTSASNPATARRIVEELRRARPDSPGIPIAEALLAVGAGDTALAERKLHEVLQEEPGLRTALSRDPDLAPLLD